MKTQFLLKLRFVLVSAILAFTSMASWAYPVQYQITLSATSGSQFGVTAPATLTGTFNVDSTFLAQPDGDYPGTAISNYLIVIGSQTFDQKTAFDPNIQGIKLLDHTIIRLGMNWSQTNAGLLGPYMQMSFGGAWESGTTVNQAGANILRGGDGSQTQTFTQLSKRLLDVDGNGTVDALTDGLMLLRYTFGLRGTSLTAGAIGPGATRSAAEIEAYIFSIMF